MYADNPLLLHYPISFQYVFILTLFFMYFFLCVCFQFAVISFHSNQVLASKALPRVFAFLLSQGRSIERAVVLSWPKAAACKDALLLIIAFCRQTQT